MSKSCLNKNWNRWLSPADRSLVQELVYGVVRWQLTLDWLIDRKASGRTKADAPHLAPAGAVSALWLDRIPNHAAVHETVELAKQLGFGSQAGFVNALCAPASVNAPPRNSNSRTCKPLSPRWATPIGLAVRPLGTTLGRAQIAGIAGLEQHARQNLRPP